MSMINWARKFDTSWESVRKCGKIWKSLLKLKKVPENWKSLRKCAERWQRVLKDETLRKYKKVRGMVIKAKSFKVDTHFGHQGQ